MNALDRKLLRDLWGSRGMALAIAAVIGSGVALFVMSLGTFQSLRQTQIAYYARYGFADVFASLKRAPLWLEARIAALPGVDRVETRVVVSVNLDVSGMTEPARGRLVSLPESGRPRLNDLHLRAGRWIEPYRDEEVLAGEAFAEAHHLAPGASVAAVINGRRKELEIVGIVLSPEYVYSLSPGEMFPDNRRFGVFWMARKPLATAFDMEGAFNDLSLKLEPGASADESIAALDRLLEPWGSLGAVPRERQMSHWYLQNELAQLEGMGRVIPTVFLGVAAFLLNVVLTRLVAVQREQIAQLKALGYSNHDLGWHYVKWGLLVALLGAVVGSAAGIWLSTGMLHMYRDYFRFPILEYHWEASTLLGALLVSLLAATAGALGAVRGAVRLPPAEAMRPAPPAAYRKTWLEGVLGRFVLLTQPDRMIVRNLIRRPVRTALSVTGIALAAAIMVVGGFALDAIDELTEMLFNISQRQDLTVSFFEPVSADAAHELARLPGVMAVEPSRSVAVRMRNGHRSRDAAILGLPPSAELQRVVDTEYRPVELPPGGLVLSSKLAQLLDVGRGETIEVEVLEGQRPRRQVLVSEVIDEYFGTSAYMEVGALHRLLREGDTLSGAALSVDVAEVDRLLGRLKLTPAVAGVSLRRGAIENFETFLADNMGRMTFFNVMFACIIAFGVVYNGARISLSERSRELASLRVLGFRRREISYILLGELALLTALAVPFGLLIGWGLVAAAVLGLETELYRMPLVVSPKTFVVAAATVLVATVLSGLIVRRRLDHLDLIAVLKTRE